MHTALTANDVRVVKMLCEVALTTTVTMRVTASLAEVAEASAIVSDRVWQEGLVVDKYVSFTDKVVLMHGGEKPDLKIVQEKGLVFNGSVRCV